MRPRVMKAQNPLGWAREALGPTTFDAAFRRGQEMTLEEVVTYALELTRWQAPIRYNNDGA